jgi:hypothetical protein
VGRTEEGIVDAEGPIPPTSSPPPGARPLYTSYGGSGGRLNAPAPGPTGGFGRAVAIAAVVVGLAVAAILALGLRDGSGNGTPFSPIAEAAETTAGQSGARFSGTGQARGSGFEMSMRFRGAFNGETDRSMIRMQTSTPAAPQVAQMMNPFVGVTDEASMYMSSPAFASELPDGKTWMKLDLSEFGADDAASMETGSIDGRAVLSQLEMVSDDARALGAEKVRGVPTTHYAATLDPELRAEQLREAGSDLGAQVVESQGGAATADVWVDHRGLVRRTAATIPFGIVAGPGATMSMTMDFYGFGAAPEIDVPSDEEAFDATDLARDGLESALGDGA